MAAGNFKGPLDYIDVATRIVEFREKYPEGRLRQKDVQFVDFAGKSWVVYTAEAWRTPDDPAPAHGTAWEPVPGPTQFTRDSELQNAETAAWGRAMVAALAVDTRKGIASSEEVRNRQQAPMKDRIAAAATAMRNAPNWAELEKVWDAIGRSGLAQQKPLADLMDELSDKFADEKSAADAWATTPIPGAS